jgi:adenine C2-methylase RlmN of 23S rRNA A2503 and tRNA A37
MGLKRNLTTYEIVEQVIFFNRYLKKITLSEAEGSSQHVTNITFMGMGEPF